MELHPFWPSCLQSKRNKDSENSDDESTTLSLQLVMSCFPGIPWMQTNFTPGNLQATHLVMVDFLVITRLDYRTARMVCPFEGPGCEIAMLRRKIVLKTRFQTYSNFISDKKKFLIVRVIYKQPMEMT